MQAHPDWLVWQLVDSAFPTGGFAHSGGLEAASQHGELRQRGDLSEFIEGSLDQVGHATLPFVSAAYSQPGRLEELDQHFDAFTSNHVTNRASRSQGRAFLMAVERSFHLSEVFNCHTLMDEKRMSGHLPPVFGAVGAWLKVDQEQLVRMFLFGHLRGLVSAAVRLGLIGPLEAQGVQHQMSGVAQSVVDRCSGIPVEDAAQTAPLLDIWQGAQDRLYSRLFQS